MIKSRNFRLRKCPFGLTLGSLLLCVSVSLCEAAPSKVDTTRIIINTSGPIAYQHRYHANPPRIIFRFFQQSVYSSLQESVSIQKGIVKSIEASYFKTYPIPGSKRPLQTLTFHLLADTTYEIIESPQSLILVIRHPEGFPESELIAGKVMLTTLPTGAFQEGGKREAEMSNALQQVLDQGSPIPTEQAPLPAEKRGAIPIQPVPTQPSTMTPWYKTPHFLYAAIFCFILGGLLWPPSWFSIQNRILRREQKRSWEMAKRIIALKEESVSLQTQITRLQEANFRLHEEAKTLAIERETLRKELKRSTEDLYEVAQDRTEWSDRFQALQSELDEKMVIQEELLKKLRELSVRHDEEISRRRELETAFEAWRSQGKEGLGGEWGEEKRRWTRLPIFPLEKQDLPLTVEVQGPAGRLIYGYPRNLSLGGMSFDLNEDVELPTPLSLTLFFSKQKSGVETQGKVVWKVQEEQNSRYGICFTDLSQNGSLLIGQFMKERFPQVREANRALEGMLKEKRSMKTAVFKLEAPSATSVALVGDFNGWDAHMHPMKKMKDGTWKVTLLLPAGSYQYQFYVDGIWQTDPHAKNRVVNPFGGENAVLEVS